MKLSNQKGFATVVFIIGAAVLVLMGLGYYIYANKQNSTMTGDIQENLSTPTQTQQVNIEDKESQQITRLITYRNLKYKYSVQYPENWYIRLGGDWYGKEELKEGKANLDNVNSVLITGSGPCDTCGGLPDGITINVEPNESLTPQQYYEKVLPRLKENHYHSQIETRPIILAGLTGLYVVVDNGDPGPPYDFIILAKGKDIVTIDLDIVFKTDYDLIIPTLKFEN